MLHGPTPAVSVQDGASCVTCCVQQASTPPGRWSHPPPPQTPQEAAQQATTEMPFSSCVHACPLHTADTP